MTELDREIETAGGAAWEVLRSVVAAEFAVRPAQTVSEWADEHRVIVEKTTARPGRWRTSFTPHLRAIMDAFGDDRVRHISMQKPVQRGGTEAVINMILYAIDRMPMNMFWVWANAENAADFAVRRMLPTIKACAPAAKHLTGRKRDEKNASIELDNMSIWFRGAPPNAKGVQNLESWSAGIIANDELDRCDPNTPEIMVDRTLAYPLTHKMIDLGSPEWEGQGIHRQLSLSAGGGLDYWQPCPHCDGFFVPNFDMVRWIGGGGADPETVKVQAWLRCPLCDGTIYGHQNRVMLERGVWAPDWDVRRPPSEQSLPPRERIDECLSAPHVGFRINEFSEPFSSNVFGDVAAKFLKNGCQRTKEWVTRVRGIAWAVDGARAQEHELRKLCVPIEAGGYRLGTVPAGVLCLETSIDVQEEGAWVRVRGWGKGGAESWLIWTEYVVCPGGDLSRVDKCVGWRFPLAPGWCDPDGVVAAGGGTMRSIITAIDSGDRTVEVYKWALRHGGVARNVFPTKGQAGVGGGGQKLQWTTPVTTLPGGEKIPADVSGAARLSLVNVNTNAWKTWVLERLRGGTGHQAPGISEGVGGGGGGGCVWRFPEAVVEAGVVGEATSEARMEQYFAQVTAEHRPEKLNKRTGRLERVWEMRRGRRDNHFFDAEVHGAAVFTLRSRGGADITRAFGVEGVGTGGPVARPVSKGMRRFAEV